MCNCLLALFFVVLLCTACLIFRSQFLSFTLFYRLHVSCCPFLVFRKFPYCILLVAVIWAFGIHPFGNSNLFWGDCQISCPFFLLMLVVDCFPCKIDLFHQFVFDRFGLFVRFLAVVCACPFDSFVHTPFASLNRPKLCLLPSLFVFLASPMLS